MRKHLLITFQGYICSLHVLFQQAPAPTINKDVFSSILPSFPQKQILEPAPVYSAALTGQ